MSEQAKVAVGIVLGVLAMVVMPDGPWYRKVIAAVLVVYSERFWPWPHKAPICARPPETGATR